MRHFSIADLARTNHMFLGGLRTALRAVPLFTYVSVQFDVAPRTSLVLHGGDLEGIHVSLQTSKAISGIDCHVG
jgi:hypothetical protein